MVRGSATGRPSTFLVAVLILFVLAGCSGYVGSPLDGSNDVTETPEITERNDVTDFATLSAGARDVFLAARDNGSIMRPRRIEDFDSGDELATTTYVSYSGAVYEVRMEATSRAKAEYTLRPRNATGTAVNSSRAISYAALGNESQDVFRRALEHGSYTSDDPFPDELRSLAGQGYVTYEGTQYRIRIAVGDLLLYRYDVDPLERSG